MTIAEIKKKFFITEQDIAHVRALGAAVLAQIPAVLDQFCNYLRTEPQFKPYFPTEDSLQNIRAIKIQHWKSFFEANLDEQYVQSRQKMGHIHAQINLPVDIYFEFVVIFRTLYGQLFKELGMDAASFHKQMDLDVSIIVKTYSDLAQSALLEQFKTLREMSTPVAELWDGVLFLPLAGIIDSKRAQDVMLTMLHKVAATQAKIFILDISGVGVLDTAVANHLIKVTKATKLMGCVCTISGISPAVAQTMVELGIQIDEISTTSTLKDALQQAFQRINIQEQLGMK